MRIFFAIVTCLIWSQVSVMAQAPRERKNIDKLTPHELEVYKHAVSLLQGSTDPQNNYVYHANLHNLFLTNPPHGCEHGNDLFFPWHRWHLANFERALRESDPDHLTLSTKDVTIPYWNWTLQASGKRYSKDFENELDSNGAKNPLFNDFRNTEPSTPFYDEAYMKDLICQNREWDQFAGGPKDVNEFYGAFENDSHNTMHGLYIGGDMGDPNSAAMDPIYWSFHAFIDMQWDRWQKIHNKPPTSLNKVLRGFRNSPTVQDTVDVTQLGYFYEHDPQSVDPNVCPTFAPPNPRSLRLLTRIAGADRSVAAWGGAGPFEFGGTLKGDFQRADVWLENVRIPTTMSYRVQIFVHPKDRKYASEDLAGSITVWKGHTGIDGTPHHTHSDMFVNVTNKLKAAQNEHAGKELTTTAVMTPIPLPTRQRTRQVHPEAIIEEEIQFKCLRLVLDGDASYKANKAKGVPHGH